MCYERYKGYTVCSHEDPQATPTNSKPCCDFYTTGSCPQGKHYVIVSEESTQTPCPACLRLERCLLDTIGNLGHGEWTSATWMLWYRIGWVFRDPLLSIDIAFVQETLYQEMYSWAGPRHNQQTIVLHWIGVFEEFKDWLRGRLGKRDAHGRPYFPPGEERGVRIEKKKVLQHLVRWTLINMAQGRFDWLDIPLFRDGLDMAFNDLIYQWDTHFLEEPGWDFAKEEFTRYWVHWFRKIGKALKQGE